MRNTHEPAVPQRRAIQVLGVAARIGRKSAPRALDRIGGSQRLSPKTGAPIRQRGPLLRFRRRIVAWEYGFDRADRSIRLRGRTPVWAED